MTRAARTTDVIEVARQLAAGLRSAGIAVGTDRVATCARALDEVELDDPEDRYWAGRLTLLDDPDQVPIYDAVVAGGSPEADAPPDDPPPGGACHEVASDRGTDDGGGTDTDHLDVGAAVSARERLRHRRFDQLRDDELEAIDAAVRQLVAATPHRPSRRRRPGNRGTELDPDRTLSHALRTGGEVVELRHRARRDRPRRLVVLLDVSGSMAGFARVHLRFALAAQRSADREAARHVEVFAFGTRLTRLTPALAMRDADAALAAATDAVVDWDGGTRIGDAVRDLVHTWAPRGVLRGAVVVLCSDGLERGEVAHLDAAMARLRRHVHRIVWVNPLAGDARYAPTQRGMRAALPHVDVLLAGHDLGGLEKLTEVVGELR